MEPEIFFRTPHSPQRECGIGGFTLSQWPSEAKFVAIRIGQVKEPLSPFGIARCRRFDDPHSARPFAWTWPHGARLFGRPRTELRHSFRNAFFDQSKRKRHETRRQGRADHRAAQGIGFGIAKRFVRAGSRMAIADLNLQLHRMRPPTGIRFRPSPRQLSEQVPPRRSRSRAAVDDHCGSRTCWSRGGTFSPRCRCSADACLSAKGAVATRRYAGAAPATPDDNNVFST